MKGEREKGRAGKVEGVTRQKKVEERQREEETGGSLTSRGGRSEMPRGKVDDSGTR